MVPRRRVSRRFLAIAAITALFLLYHFTSLQSTLTPQPTRFRYSGSRTNKYTTSNADTEQTTGEPDPICPPLPGIEDVLVVMKTGVTESRDKVPIHFSTTLRCIPHYVIYSDFEEEIEGVTIHDALRTMDRDVTQQVEDFDLYNRLKKLGREGLEQGDFADEANSAIGKPNNPGWKLDKWKFLPMAQEAYAYKSDAKWFIFMEADTYISWPTVLAWLARFDPTKPVYLGTETQIADTIFAHGGSGFMLSNPALRAASDEYERRRADLDDYTNGHWAGDCVLGRVLADVGVDLHFSWPILQNSNLGELDEFATDLYRLPWCYIAVGFHHLSPADIEGLWKFEQKRWHDKNKRILLHSDVFREWLYPEMLAQPTRLDWDNFSDEEQPYATTFEHCRQVCETEKKCVQFSFRDGTCFTGNRPRLGVSRPGSNAASGWLTSRVRGMMDVSGSCRAPEYGD
ncbi:hypothetical protein N7466_006017 [Penicillium verhagenii]|uniref:uncharacterized protein n=1 Tax=Penicillium verhagenii TaxID=1562060 RepID=UPI0025453DBF|nr:uncharacterized protein N7466_006017 [Penicillium verhagenii]KAJ5930524.1 hypothetical protein N7466_006017 [Penicillium verhagenii]